MSALGKRYSEAIKRLGGAPGILALPQQVKDVLKGYYDLETKVKMMELIADKREEQDRAKGGIIRHMYVVYMISAGGVKRDMAVFDHEEDAACFCNDRGWTYTDENRFEWSLDYREV